MRILQGPAKGIAILAVIAGLMVVGLLALEGKFTPKKPAYDKIIFVSDRGGRPSLWMMNTDGSSPTRLTSGDFTDAAPSWSADGTRILFTSERNGVAQIFTVLSMRPKDPQQITVGTGVKLRPILSSSGRDIAYLQQGRVYISNLDGSDIEPLLPPLESAAGAESSGAAVNSPYTVADWSSDSKSLAGVQQTDTVQLARILMSIHGDHSEHERDAEDMTDLDGRPLAGSRVSVKWSSVGRKIAVSIASANDGALVVRDYDADSFTVVTPGLVPGQAAWSPEGTRLAFETLGYHEGKAYSNTGLAVAAVESGEPRLIVKGDATSPSWTADGKKIIFTMAGENGFRDIWSINPDGSGAKNLTGGKGDNYDAVASPARAK